MSTAIILTRAFLENACETLEHKHEQELVNRRAAFKTLDRVKYNSWQRGVHLDSLFNTQVLAVQLLNNFSLIKEPVHTIQHDEIMMIAEKLIEDPNDAEDAITNLAELIQEPVVIDQ